MPTLLFIFITNDVVSCFCQNIWLVEK